MSAVYSILTSPTHPPVPKHLPTLIVTPHGNPDTVLYTLLHTNMNRETYLLTPSKDGELCVAKLFPPSSRGGSTAGGSSSSVVGPSGHNVVKCEASRNLRWHITQSGIQNPIYKVTLLNPDSPDAEQPLFQASKPNPNASWWTLWYFTYAGHLIPPKRVEFGRIQKNEITSNGGAGTRVTITGKTAEEKAVWQALGDESNADMIEWIVLCLALIITDDEIIQATANGQRDPASGMSPPTGSKMGSSSGPCVEPARNTSIVDTRTAPRQPRSAPAMQQPSSGQPSRGQPMPKPVPAVSGYPLPPPISNGGRTSGRGPSPKAPPQERMQSGHDPRQAMMPQYNGPRPLEPPRSPIPPQSPMPPQYHYQSEAKQPSRHHAAGHPPQGRSPRAAQPHEQHQQQFHALDPRYQQDQYHAPAQSRHSPVVPPPQQSASHPHPYHQRSQPPPQHHGPPPRSYQLADRPVRGSSAQQQQYQQGPPPAARQGNARDMRESSGYRQTSGPSENGYAVYSGGR